MNKEIKIFIAGEQGFVGRNIKEYLKRNGYLNFISSPPNIDYTRQEVTEDFIKKEKPDIVILASGKVGGIGANKKYPAEFIYNNIMIWSNIIYAAAENDVSKLIFLGSATVYPETAPVPFKEEYILSGKLEKNTEPYAFAKITAIKLCEALYREKRKNFIALTLANLYGPYDHFNFEDAHIIPSVISKIHDAKLNNLESVTLWGTGQPTRDCLYIGDLADAILFSMENISAELIYENNISHLNIGTGEEIRIKEICETIKNVIDYKGEIRFDAAKPDGTLRKYLDATRINNMGWRSKINLETGIKKTYKYYIENCMGN